MDKVDVLKYLVGKTIKSARIEGFGFEIAYDDAPFLILDMTDGTQYRIIADYGGFTGNSQGEYPRFIKIEKVK